MSRFRFSMGEGVSGIWVKVARLKELWIYNVGTCMLFNIYCLNFKLFVHSFAYSTYKSLYQIITLGAPFSYLCLTGLFHLKLQWRHWRTSETDTLHCRGRGVPVWKRTLLVSCTVMHVYNLILPVLCNFCWYECSII